MKKYIIRCINTPNKFHDEKLYWNNDTGWGSKETADVHEGINNMLSNLPNEGEWEELKQ